MAEKQGVKDNALELESKSNSPITIDKTVLQSIIGTVSKTEKLTEDPDRRHDQGTVEKTDEDDNTEQTNSKTSRELKLLLALSKEANLDTNISHKRKTLEGNKFKDKESSPKINTLESDAKKISKVAHENRNIRYPVTAESELELDIQENEVKNLPNNSIKTSKRKRDSLSELNTGGATEEATKRSRKSFSTELAMFKPNKDIFCWRCHREGVNIACETCPRSYHQKCLKQTINNTEHWPCPECVSILKAESTQTRSEAMKGMTLEHLCGLLKFAVNRMIQCQGSEPFLHPVSDNEFPDYKKYIIQPMDLTKIEKNIKGNLYGSTQAFEADAKWLLHNSIIFNSYQSKLTSAAKSIVKICKQEMAEIENCPSCYLNANTKKNTWFVEVCPKPHLIVWAKLKGFPYWPAKAMCTNSSGMVDVRFFGAHDRAWVHYKECYLFSEKDPNTFKQKRYDIEKCVEELNIYIQNLQKIYGEFKYAPYKTLLEPNNDQKQLQIFLPKYKSQPSPKKRITKAEAKFIPQEIKDINIENTPITEKIEQNPESKGGETLQNEIPAEKVIDTTEIQENVQNKNDEGNKTQSDLKKEPKKQNLTQKDTQIGTNGTTEFPDDSIMEGYGTDDDTIPEINLERRKTFIGRKNDVSAPDKVEQEEEEEDNDTQVPSNISVDDSVLRSNVRMRGGLSSPTGKIKILPRRTSDTENNQKRQSTEDIPHSPQKVSRRNSDQSVKSDSSRISNISDKINRVDISENMEITLGNDDISCISISETISSSNEPSKSSSDHVLENKKKPVQVDIENTEFTISPSNKLKISDKLMKRLSDGGESATNAPKVNEVKKAVLEKKSPTDILIEKFKGVVEHEVIDFSHSTISPECHTNNDACNTNDVSQVSTTGADKVNDFSDTSIPVNEKALNTETDSSSDHTSENLTSNEINELTATSSLVAPEKNKTAEKENDEVDDMSARKEVTHTDKQESLTPQIDKKINDETENLDLEESEKCDSETSTTVGKQKVSEPSKEEGKKQKSLIQSSITQFTTSGKQTIDNDKQNINDISPPKDISEAQDTDNDKFKNGDSSSQSKGEKTNIIEEAEDSEEMEILEDIQIDKDNIFNIIHSSLNAAKTKEDHCKKSAEVKKPTISDTSSNKRKLNPDESIIQQAKLVKLVSIESILKKHTKENLDNSLLQKSLQVKRMIRKPSSTSPASSTSRQSSVQEITPEEIKSEPETDDDFSESENLEAKRKYLSALNISEKVHDSDKTLKGNEIRTRSKTEEKKEKFRVIDNLTRTIDDVALNYSANHDGQELPLKKPESKQNNVNNQEGEIFVKSFAKIQTPKQKARKSFPAPAYVKSTNQFNLIRKEALPTVATAKETPKISGAFTTRLVPNTSTTVTQVQKTVDTVNTSMSHVILLPPNQTISYNSALVNPILSVVSPIISSTTANMSSQSVTLSKAKTPIPNTRASQNYIPQNEELQGISQKTNNIILNELLNQPLPNTAREPETTTDSTENNSNTATVEATTDLPPEDDLNVLNSLLPENVRKAVSDLLLRPPPRLKPRPPGMLSTTFDDGIPSSAGNVTAKINSVAHRLGDYFRGMLIETLGDLGKSSNPEAKITSLQLEIESLKHRHDVELSEIRKNVCTILKDIQKSIVEDRDRIIDETRAACEAETIKRVELAKSKQCISLHPVYKNKDNRDGTIQGEMDESRDESHLLKTGIQKNRCANCSKEAQFYCCWNTSYCDYPCQQKHWPQHLGKCTQNIEKTSNTVTLPNRPPGQQLILRPAIPPKPGLGRIVAKPTKVYMNRNAGPPKTFKTLTTTGNHLTVIETTPGNYELLGNGPIAVTGKFLATSSNIFNSKFKHSNTVTVSSPSTSGTSDQRSNQKATITSDSTKSTTAATNTSLPITTTLDDDSD